MRSRFRKRSSAERRDDDELVEVFFGEPQASAASPADERRLKQLCREVYRVLSQVLPGEVSDPVLDGVAVLEVVPAPDASRLAIRLAVPEGADVGEVIARLQKLKGHLRAEIASAIQRKRTPELVFEVTA